MIFSPYNAVKQQYILDYIGVRVVVGAVSSGKEATTMALPLKELNTTFQSVLIATKW